MHEYLLESLVCPVCHGALEWKLTERTGARIESGRARCRACAVEYPVVDGIGVFVPEPRDIAVAEQESRQMRYLRDHPEIEETLLRSPLDALNPADQYYRAQALEARGEFAAAKVAADRAQQGLYLAQSQADIESQFETVIAHLAGSDGPIVDLASGRCYLVEALLRALQRPIVATDISLPVLRRDRRYLEHWGLYDRVSLLALDARQTPFCDGAVESMTTFVGLASVREPGAILEELRRAVSGTLLSISVFCSPEDEVHAPAIRKAGLEAMLFRRAALAAFVAAGWQVEVVNARTAPIRPTPTSALMPEFRVDGFPLAETTQESCTLIAR